MPADFKLFLTKNGYYDIRIENGSYVKTNALDTALYMSIFGETRALAEQIAIPTLRRGEVINVFNNNEGYEIGSKMWLYTTRATNTVKNTELIRVAIKDGLKWLIDDGIVNSTSVNVVQTNSKLHFSITLQAKNGETLQYEAFIQTFI